MACSLRASRYRLAMQIVPLQFLADPRLIRLCKALFWAALIFACVMAVLPKPPQTPIDKLGDKFAHMLAFATLGGLAMGAFGREARWRIVERLAFLGAVIEVVQSIPALHRTCDIRDWLADLLAVVVAVLVAGFLVPPRKIAG
jgi:VanZ family protein